MTARSARELPHEPGEYELTIDVGGTERSYVLLIPDSYRDDRAVPLVIGFHGACKTPREIIGGVQGWGAVAEDHGFVLVAPLGLDGVFFGYEGCPEWAVLRNEQELALLESMEAYQPDRVYEYFLEEIAEFSVGSRDVAFASELLDTIPAALNIDLDRVFLTGFSLGGWMASRAACDLGERVRAVAPTFHSLLISHPCPNSTPVAVASVGDESGYRTLARQALAEWADHHGCNPASTEETKDGPITRLRYTDCARGTRVEMYHSPADGHPPHEALIAWEFFASLP